MKYLLTIALLFAAFVSNGAEFITATFTVTNAPADADTIVVSGSTRTWKTTVATASTQVAIAASAGGSATNLFNHFGSYPVSGVVLSRSSTNVVVFRGSGLTASFTGTWGTLVLTTNTVGAGWSVSVPFSNNASTNRENIANLLVADLVQYSSTSQLNQNSNITSQLVGKTNTQTIAGNKTFTGTNVFNNTANQFHGLVTNATLYFTGGSGTNLYLYAVTIYGGTINGAIGLLTNGFLTNTVLSGVTTTNLINYGNAVSSVGSAENSEQFGSSANASGIRATALGKDSSASQLGSIALGYSSISSQTNAISIGSALANGLNSIALGNIAKSTNDNSVAIGYQARTTTSNQVVLGSSTVEYVYTPGRIEAIGGLTNAHLKGSNTISGAVAYTRYDITTLANTPNVVDIGTNQNIKVSGPTAAFPIVGFIGGRDGRDLEVQYDGGYAVTITHNSGLTDATNRIYTGTGADVTLTNSPLKIQFRYDSSIAKWVLKDVPGSAVAGVTSVTVDGTANKITSSGSPITGSGTITLTLADAIDIGSHTSFEIPNAAAPSTTVFGQIAGDNNAWAASRGAVQHYDGTANTYLVGTLLSDAPSNGQVPKWNTGGTITWENDTSGGNNFTTSFYTNGSSQIGFNNTNVFLVGPTTNAGNVVITNGSLVITNTGTSAAIQVDASGSVTTAINNGDFNVTFNSGQGINFGSSSSFITFTNFTSFAFTSADFVIADSSTPIQRLHSKAIDLYTIGGGPDPVTQGFFGNADGTVGVAGGLTNVTVIEGGGTTTTGAKLNGIKIYRALVSQAGTAAPTATVLENTLGGAGSWARSSAGVYTFTLSGAFTANKTFPRSTVIDLAAASAVTVIRTDANVVTLTSGNLGASGSDDMLNVTPIEILVYP